MDFLKLANDWAKAELLSSKFFVLFGILFLLVSLGFWQIGKTETAKAFVYPSLITASLLIIVGCGLYFSNTSRLANFSKAYEEDSAAFVEAEIQRADKTIHEYDLIVFKIIPLIMIVCALLIIFVDKANWRASCIATIGMLIVISIVDSNAKARMEKYKDQLVVNRSE